MKIIGLNFSLVSNHSHRQAAMTYCHVEAVLGGKEIRTHGKSQPALWTGITVSVLTASASSRGPNTNHIGIPSESPIPFASE